MRHSRLPRAGLAPSGRPSKSEPHALVRPPLKSEPSGIKNAASSERLSSLDGQHLSVVRQECVSQTRLPPPPSERAADTLVASRRAPPLIYVMRLALFQCAVTLAVAAAAVEPISLIQTPFRHSFVYKYISVVSDARRNFPGSYLFDSRLTDRKIGISQRHAI